MVDARRIAVEVVDLDGGAGTGAWLEMRRNGQIHCFATTADLQRWLKPLGFDLGRLFAPSPDEDGCE